MRFSAAGVKSSPRSVAASGSLGTDAGAAPCLLAGAPSAAGADEAQPMAAGGSAGSESRRQRATWQMQRWSRAKED